MNVVIPWSKIHGPVGAYTDMTRARRAAKELGWKVTYRGFILNDGQLSNMTDAKLSDEPEIHWIPIEDGTHPMVDLQAWRDLRAENERLADALQSRRASIPQRAGNPTRDSNG